MSRSATSSPLRKKSRLSSPTYDAHFDELDSYDFHVLDEIETSFSQSVVATPVKSPNYAFHRTEKRRHAIEDALKAANLQRDDDSGIALVVSEGRNNSVLPISPPSHPQPSPPHALGFKSAASLPLVVDIQKEHDSHVVPNPGSAAFLPVSLLAHADNLNGNVWRLPSPERPPAYDHDIWFAPADISSASARTFTSVSALQDLPARITRSAMGFDPPGVGAASSTSSQKRSKSTWASPSVGALEQARKKMQTWEAEIETELSVVGREIVSGMHNGNKQPIINREPLRGAENTFPSPSMSRKTPAASVPLNDLDPHSTAAPLRPFKAPVFTTPRSNSNISTPSRPFGVPFTSVVSRSSAAADLASPEAPLTSSRVPPVTPIRPKSSHGSPQPQTSQLPTLSRPSEPSQYQTTTPQKARPLGLSPRAYAFTSRASPKFVTPFKRGKKPDDGNTLQWPHSKPTIQPRSEGKGKEREAVPSTVEAAKPIKHCDEGVETPTRSNCISLVNSKLVPHVCNHDDLNNMGLDVRLLNLATVSHFLYYRFEPTGTGTDSLSTQMSLGSDSALEALLAMDYHLATKAWVDNHWSLILWKMIGMACLEPTKAKKRWCWNEVMRQLRYRYERELASGSRPALRLIAAQDAPSSRPLILCISDVFWKDEYVDAHGQLVPAHPELEITDGWYRLRATVDEVLARAARNEVLRVGRKIACSGAKLESSKKNPMDVLDAYGSAHLTLSGNSTHLASWHAKLGFQSAPFVATLGSLTSDGGGVSLADLIITQVFPVAFIEFITTEKGEAIREGPRTEKDEAVEEDRWNDRRSDEVAKLWDKLEKKINQLQSYADRLEQIAGSEFCPTEDESPPDNIEDLIEELEDSKDPAYIIKGINKEDAGWLSLLLRKKCETDRGKSGDKIDRELASSFPPRQVRNFRVLQVKDARTVRKPSWRTAQLTVWDVMSLNITEGGSPGSFHAGQRYLVSSLVPSHQSAWMELKPGSEIYLSTKRDSKWRLIN